MSMNDNVVSVEHDKALELVIVTFTDGSNQILDEDVAVKLGENLLKSVYPDCYISGTPY